MKNRPWSCARTRLNAPLSSYCSFCLRLGLRQSQPDNHRKEFLSNRRALLNIFPVSLQDCFRCKGSHLGSSRRCFQLFQENGFLTPVPRRAVKRHTLPKEWKTEARSSRSTSRLRGLP